MNREQISYSTFCGKSPGAPFPVLRADPSFRELWRKLALEFFTIYPQHKKNGNIANFVLAMPFMSPVR